MNWKSKWRKNQRIVSEHGTNSFYKLWNGSGVARDSSRDCIYKKPKIGKFEGHYHGGLNQVLVSINPSKEVAGDAKEPTPVYESEGIPEDQKHQTIVLPFNDLEATEALLRNIKMNWPRSSSNRCKEDSSRRNSRSWTVCGN
jgi:Glutamate-1-semialdehyde aminotransferase